MNKVNSSSYSYLDNVSRVDLKFLGGHNLNEIGNLVGKPLATT